MAIKFCPYCDGTGKMSVLKNYADYHYNAEAPEFEEIWCEYCDIIYEDELPELTDEEYDE